jgi:hypothetical protein
MHVLHRQRHNHKPDASIHLRKRANCLQKYINYIYRLSPYDRKVVNITWGSFICQLTHEHYYGWEVISNLVAEGLFLAEHCMLEAEVEIQIHYYGHDLSLYMPSKK